MKKKNLWSDGVNTVSSPTRPVGYWYPVISASRVKGAKYTPYTKGSPEWVKAANAALASAAQENFERRR